MAFADPSEILKRVGLRLGARVADFGSGSGHFALAAAKLVGEEGRIYAVDVQHDLLTRLKKEARGKVPGSLEILWGDLEKPGGSKLATQSVDLVVASNILFQLDHKSGMFQEAKRVLKPKGKLVLIDWTDSFGGMGPQPQDVVTLTHARKLAEEAGFVMEGEFPAGDHHWGATMNLPHP